MDNASVPRAYQKTQKEYASLYEVSLPTIKRWWKQGLPLDDPDAMGEHRSPAGRKPAGYYDDLRPQRPRLAELVAARAPAPTTEILRGELYHRLLDADETLRQARDFVRKHELEGWRKIVELLNPLADGLEAVFEAAGIGDDFAPPPHRRADLGKSVLWNWVEDREATRQEAAEMVADLAAHKAEEDANHAR